jgi:hypothetical protein
MKPHLEIYINNLKEVKKEVPSENIWNCDNPGDNKVLTKLGLKYLGGIHNSSNTSISLIPIYCGSAARELLPFMWPRSKVTGGTHGQKISPKGTRMVRCSAFRF